MKEKLEQLYEKRVEGIIVRSRARWHENGKRNSKYFFNLEKRNHIRKYIRKLNLRANDSKNQTKLENQPAFIFGLQVDINEFSNVLGLIFQNTN